MDKEKILHKIITVMAFSIILSLSLSSMGCGRSVEIKDVDTRADISFIDRTDDGRIIDSIPSYEDAEHLPMDIWYPYLGLKKERLTGRYRQR